MLKERRLQLHEMLTTRVLGSDHAYYQPPPNLMLHYPCIVYDIDNVETTSADNINYLGHPFFRMTLIDYDPETGLFDKMMSLPKISFDRSYKSNNLNHWVFTIYF